MSSGESVINSHQLDLDNFLSFQSVFEINVFQLTTILSYFDSLSTHVPHTLKQKLWQEKNIVISMLAKSARELQNYSESQGD